MLLKMVGEVKNTEIYILFCTSFIKVNWYNTPLFSHKILCSCRKEIEDLAIQLAHWLMLS